MLEFAIYGTLRSLREKVSTTFTANLNMPEFYIFFDLKYM